MAGRPGRSGGWNRLTDEEHRARGTKRRRPLQGARASALPVSGTMALQPVPNKWAGVLPGQPATPTAASWTPTVKDRAGLRTEGRVFLDSLLAEFEFSGIEGKLALEAAHAVDRLKAIRRISKKAETLREVAAIERLDQGWSKLLTALLAQLKVSR